MIVNALELFYRGLNRKEKYDAWFIVGYHLEATTRP